jgi:carbon-monoxide dehydrogenase medium subunit
MRPFEYFEPENLTEALEILHRYGEKAKVLAGGTDLVVQMKQKKLAPEAIVNIVRLRDLAAVEILQEGPRPALRLGPLTLLSTLATHPCLPRHLGLLREAALAVGDPQIRNAATIGGNLANGSPSADMAPSLMVLGAAVELQSAGGSRTIPIEEFYLAPFKTRMTPEELIVGINIQPIPEGGGVYLWMPKRTTVDETLVGVAAWLQQDPATGICEKVALSLNSVSPVPTRAKEAESFLLGKVATPQLFKEAGEIASREVFPRSRADYRRRIVSVLTGKALEKAWMKNS